MKQATSKNIEHLQQAINVQQTCADTMCTYINNILPCITKLEQTVLKLQQKITMDQDRVQINAPDHDLDIDGHQHPRRHTNTAVVSVQDYFPLSESQAKDRTAVNLTLYTTILRSPMGMKISPQTFKIILQHKIELT